MQGEYLSSCRQQQQQQQQQQSSTSRSKHGKHKHKHNHNQNHHHLLLAHPWKRVILDEAHCIKNPTTAVHKACCFLRSEKRWVVTGTPIQNSLEDVYGLIKFLQHEPWCEAAFWKATISKVLLLDNVNINVNTNANINVNATTPIKDIQHEDHNNNNNNTGLKEALNRVKRVIRPLILRRTKETLDETG